MPFKYAIASGHHLTNQVGEDVLHAGGNCFDAAIACFLAMAITEPAMASSFAGGFANLWHNEKGNLLIDYFCQTPISGIQNKPNYTKIEVDFDNSIEVFYAGPASMAVSGAMKMIHFLARNFGTIPLKVLAEPAISLAKNGVQLTPFQHEDLVLLQSIFGLNAHGRSLFYNENGIKEIGDKVQMTGYADFLYSFSREDEEWMYKGEIAKKVVSYCAENGGHLTLEDFSAYKLGVSKPLLYSFNNHLISSPSFPSFGGPLLSLFLDQYQKTIQNEYLSELLDCFSACIPLTKNRLALEKELRNRDINIPDSNTSENIFSGGTSHFSIVDAAGNAIALSTSIGEGSGYFIPGTDIQMNNMLGETALLPNGLDSWKKNERLSSMMTPILVFNDEGNLSLVGGTGGATRIPYSLAQLVIKKYHHNVDLEEAILAPRLYMNEKRCYAEGGLDIQELDIPQMKFQWNENHLLFGGIHAIDVEKETAMGDPRREGSAKVKF